MQFSYQHWPDSLGVLPLAFKFTVALLDYHPLPVIRKSGVAYARSVCSDTFAAFYWIDCEPGNLAHC